MLKKLLLLLVPIMALPLALSTTVSSFDNASMVVAEDEEEVFTYQEYTDVEYDYILRHYDPCKLIPTVEKKFCAPSGYTFTLSYSDEQVDALLNEMDKCKARYHLCMLDPIFYYGLEGTEVYATSNPHYTEDRDDARQYILNTINGTVLFEIKELTVATNLSFKFEFEFVGEDSNYRFVLENHNIHVEPYDEYDFISVYARYYIRRGESRFNIQADLIDGFFYEYPDFNPYGFHTDETDEDYWGNQIAKYEITFFAHDTVPLGTVTANHDGFEMYYSDNNDIDVRARLTFVSGEVTYTYWSKPIIVGDPEFATIVDGYENRDFIRRNEEHDFTLHLNPHMFNNEIGFVGYFEVEAVWVYLDDSDYGHIYRSRDEFPEVGEVGHYYYVLSEEEAASYNPNDKSFKCSNGLAYIWDEENHSYDYFVSHTVINTYNPDTYDIYDDDWNLIVDDYTSDEILTNKTSLPFAGKYQYFYRGTLICPYGGMNFDITKDETIRVVKGKEPSETLSLNVPDNVNLYTGGDAITIIPTLSSYDESLVYYYEHELSNSGVVETVQDENGNILVTPLKAGVTSLTISVESRNFNKIIKTVDIHVVDTVYDVAKIDAPASYISAGDDVRCAINIRGISGFQNLDVDWKVANRNGESVNKEKIVDNNDASITIKDADIGDYTISASYKGVELDRITRQVRYQENSVTPTEDTIILNVPDYINLLAGGDTVDVIPTVSNYDESVEYYFDYELSKDNVINVQQSESGKLNLSPINAGTCSLTVKVNYKPNHVIIKTVSVRVLDAIYDVASIKVPDEFHYAGKDLTCAINIRGFTNFQNLDIKWVVKNKKGEELPEGQVIDNGDATITITEPNSDDYTISASYEDVLLDTVIVKVRQVDMNKFLRMNIWWIFLLTVGMVVLIFFLRNLIRKGKTTVESIERVYEVYCACLSDDKLTLEELKRINKEIKKCLHRCEDMNIEALNQYEKAIRYLRKSLADCKNLLQHWENISPEDKGVFSDRLDKDLAKALNVAKEIENAKQLSEQYHNQANKKNYETVEDDSSKNNLR